MAWNLKASCDYRVTFSPQSVGKKTAQLVVYENGITTTATLTGEGIFGCRAYLVSCNYADHYSGEITIRTVDSTTSGKLGRKARSETTVDLTIKNGVADCTGVQTDFEEEYNGAVLEKRSSTKGVINGPGVFAVEFRQAGASIEYILHFDCPTATTTNTFIDYIAGTTSTDIVPAEPAEWRHASLVADPQRAARIGMAVLMGRQLDPHTDNLVNDVAGFSSMVWLLKRR